MLTQILRKIVVVTPYNQGNVHRHLHISIPSPLYPTLPLTIQAKWKQHLHCDLWIRLSDHWSVWQENAGSDPLLQKMMTLVKVSLANQCPDSSILTNPTSTTFNERYCWL